MSTTTTGATARRRGRDGPAHQVTTAGPPEPPDPTEPPNPPEPAEPLGVRWVHDGVRTIAAVQDALPESHWPVYLAAGALALTGLVDWPVAVGGTVLYLVAKHWPVPRPE